MTWTKKNTADLDKELHYALYMVKKPVVITYPDGEVVKFAPPRQVVVSPNFYRSAECQVCKKCCGKVSFTKFWTEREFTLLREQYPEQVASVDWRIVPIGVNGHTIPFVTLPESEGSGCPFLDEEKGCLVHNINPLHCRMPLIKVKNKNGMTRVTKEAYGRNWVFGCIAEFGPLPREEFEAWDLEVFGRLKGLISDLQIPTRIDWVIRELKRLFPEPITSSSILSL